MSLGGGLSPVLGAIADAHGVAASLLTIAGLALAGTLIAFTLPERKPSREERCLASFRGSESVRDVRMLRIEENNDLGPAIE